MITVLALLPNNFPPSTSHSTAYPTSGFQEGEPTGLGLGLYITRAIVEQHGGRMDIQSHPGEGSTFSILLPVLTDETKVSHESTTETLQLQIAWTVGLSVQP